MLATTLLTAAKTDMTVHKNTIWEIPETADSAMEGQPGGAAPPRGRYMTAGPDRSGLVALLRSLFLCSSMHLDSKQFSGGNTLN